MLAVEGCTGWQFVVEELQRAGVTALLAEPADTADLRGPKWRAKTGKTDARHLRTLVADGRVPVSRIPPAQVCELRALLHLYRDLREEHTAWTQRIHATLLHQGAPGLAGRPSDPQVRARIAGQSAEPGLSAAGAQAVQVAMRRMDDLEALALVHAQIVSFARRQPGCKTLAAELYGVGPLAAAPPSGTTAGPSIIMSPRPRCGQGSCGASRAWRRAPCFAGHWPCLATRAWGGLPHNRRTRPGSHRQCIGP